MSIVTLKSTPTLLSEADGNLLDRRLKLKIGHREGLYLHAKGKAFDTLIQAFSPDIAKTLLPAILRYGRMHMLQKAMHNSAYCLIKQITLFTCKEEPPALTSKKIVHLKNVLDVDTSDDMLIRNLKESPAQTQALFLTLSSLFIKEMDALTDMHEKILAEAIEITVNQHNMMIVHTSPLLTFAHNEWETLAEQVHDYLEETAQRTQRYIDSKSQSITDLDAFNALVREDENVDIDRAIGGLMAFRRHARVNPY